jgi:hypothetical protein
MPLHNLNLDTDSFRVGNTQLYTQDGQVIIGNTLIVGTNTFSIRVSANGFIGNNSTDTGGYNLNMVGNAANYIAGDIQLDKTITPDGTNSDQTIDKNAGSINFETGNTSVLVTNARVTVNSIIVATVATNDSTMKSVAAVPASGSFTLYPDTTPSANTRVNFLVIN